MVYTALFGLVSLFMYMLKFFLQKFYYYVTFNWKLFGTFQLLFFLTGVFWLRLKFLTELLLLFYFLPNLKFRFKFNYPGGWKGRDWKKGRLEMEITESNHPKLFQLEGH